MIIDAHQHFWRYHPTRYAWITDNMELLRRDYLPADLRPVLRENGVDACIAVQARQSDQETQFLLELAAGSPEIIAVVGWIDLTSPAIFENLQRYREFSRLRGFRHIVQDEPDDHFLLREDVVRGIAALHSFGYPYDVLVYPRQLPAAVELMRRLPEQKFVIDHIAKPDLRRGVLEPWASQIRSVAKYPHVYCKVSGLVTEANWQNWSREDFRPFLDVVWEAFGAKRLMFGSDWPVCLLASDYPRVKELIDNYVQQFTSAERAQIFGETAARFYGVESAAA